MLPQLRERASPVANPDNRRTPIAADRENLGAPAGRRTQLASQVRRENESPLSIRELTSAPVSGAPETRRMCGLHFKRLWPMLLPHEHRPTETRPCHLIGK